jgi:hypothetical protein
LILFDEGHHNVAATWTTLKEKFPAEHRELLGDAPAR